MALRVLIGKSKPPNGDDLEPLPHTWQLVLCSPPVFEALKAKKEGKGPLFGDVQKQPGVGLF